MKKIVCFGDMLVGFSPVGYRRFIQADSMEISYTSAEANVSVSLSCLGLQSDFVTRLPEHDIAKCAVAALRKYGVGTEKIVYGGDRMGVIYTEKGASQRPSKVIYDRDHTAFSTAKPGDFDWEYIFSDAQWFHFTGITAALSDSCAQLCMEACRTAKAHGIKVSCDLNYRKKLWTEEKARQVMSQLVPYCDLLIGNEEDADKVLGIRAANSDVRVGQLDRDDYLQVARQIEQLYGIPTVAITLRESISASDNRWSAMLYNHGSAFFSRKYDIHIVNRVGGGDSFSAALIFSLVNAYDEQNAIEFAVAASCLKHSIELDYNLMTVEEVERLANGDASGRVRR